MTTLTLTSLVLLHLMFGTTIGQLSEKSVKQILDYHNKVRSKIALGNYLIKFDNTTAGPSSDMIKLSWDSKIAKRAQKFADTCPTDHSQGNYGENLYWAWSSAPISDIEPYGLKASKSWESEFETYGLPTTVFNDLKIGHATQMAWATTSKIGCGASFCDNRKKVTVVCQYYPPGNYYNANIFEKGRKCSKCSEEASCEISSGLCI